MSKTSMRELKVEDFLKMTHQRLLSYWLCYDIEDVKVNTDGFVAQFERSIASFEAHGRDNVACILGTSGYETENKPVKEVSLKDAQQILLNLHKDKDYRFFTVGFVKRQDQTFRKMTCRYGVTKHLKDGEKSFKDNDYNLSTVYDPTAEPRYTNTELALLLHGSAEEQMKVRKQPGGYRSIPLEGLISMKIAGQEYVITENKDLLEKLHDTNC